MAEITTQTRLYHGKFAFRTDGLVGRVLLIDLRAIDFFWLMFEIGCAVKRPLDKWVEMPAQASDTSSGHTDTVRREFIQHKLKHE